MKLPRILAQTDVPVANAPRYSSAATSGQLAVAEGISTLGKAVSGALTGYSERIQKAEQELRKAESGIEVGTLRAGAENQIAAMTQELRASTSDPD